MNKEKLLKIVRLFLNREVIVYVIAGVLATLVNIAVFTLLSALFGNDRWWISNAPAIIAAILFAFFTNRIFVFRSRGPIWQELGKFVVSRLFISLIFEYGALFLLYNLIGLTAVWHFWHWDILISKLLTQILVMIGNYVLSKWFIFTRQAA
jgi:putative flippase GtrA